MQLCLNQFVICLPKADFFIYLPNTCLNNADSGHVLLHNGIDVIQLCLQFGKLRVCLGKAKYKTAYNKRKRTEYDKPEVSVQPEHEKDAPEH